MNARNNPLNVKWAHPNDHSQVWNGSTGYDDRGHAIFTCPNYGVRAAMRTLQRKWLNGKRSIRAIIEDWAPATDTIGSIPGKEHNNPREYAHFVASRCNINAHDELPDPASHPLIWAQIIAAMSRYEIGEPCPWDIVLAGINLWERDFVESAGAKP